MAQETEKEYTLLETWRGLAYGAGKTRKQSEAFWGKYFTVEKAFYEKILSTDEVITGTVKELAARFGVEVLVMVGFLDGINDSLKVKNPIEEMTEDTVVNLDYDKELLYKNMVDAKAEWLYTLEAWNTLIPDEERRKELYREQKSANTVVKAKKISRNEPCPCGSGKKYKMCCGR